MSASAWSQRAVQRHSHVVHLSLICELRPTHRVHCSYRWEFSDTNVLRSVHCASVVGQLARPPQNDKTKSTSGRHHAQ